MIACTLWFCYLKGRSRRYLLLPVFLFLGFVRMRSESQPLPLDCKAERLEDRMVSVTGQIKSRSFKNETWSIITEQNQVGLKNEVFNLSRLLVYLKNEDIPQSVVGKLQAGKKIVVKGRLEPLPQPRNPGEFNSVLYYRSLHIRYRFYVEKWESIDGEALPYDMILSSFKQHCLEVLDQITVPEDGGIFHAAILGDKNALDGEIKDLYQVSGIAHVLAISGLHVSVIGMGLYRICRKIGFSYGISGMVCGCLMISYGIMTGASSSVVRAVLMLLCVLVAEYLGRTYDMLSAAALACILLLLESPFIITQGGFLLSFGAVFAIGSLGRWMVKWTGVKHRIWQTGIMSLAIQLVTYPILLYYFYQYPLYGILLNLVVVPLMTYVVCSGILGIILGSFIPMAGMVAVGTGHYILMLYEWLCEWVSRLPYANLIFGRPEWQQLVCYYGFLAIFVWISAKKMGDFRIQKKLGMISLLTVCCFLLLMPQLPSGLEVTFLDVGQGDGIFLQTQRGTVLVDGGSSSVKKLGQYRLEPFLKCNGVGRIDYAIISHGDQDHMNGLVELLESDNGIWISNLVIPEAGRGDSAYDKVRELVIRQGGDVYEIKKGDLINIDQLKISCLYPDITTDKKVMEEDRNEQSLVLQVDYGKFHMLLTGDMSIYGETNVLGDTALRDLDSIQVLKVAHHGSETSSGESFLDQLTPKWAVVSYGSDNSYGHPHKVVMDRLKQREIEIWETAKQGAILLQTDGKSIVWKTFRP